MAMPAPVVPLAGPPGVPFVPCRRRAGVVPSVPGRRPSSPAGALHLACPASSPSSPPNEIADGVTRLFVQAAGAEGDALGISLGRRAWGFLHGLKKKEAVVDGDHGVALDEVGLGLFDALFASLSMILVSEILDETFIIAALMAMRDPKSIVLYGALSTLAFVTALALEGSSKMKSSHAPSGGEKYLGLLSAKRRKPSNANIKGESSQAAGTTQDAAAGLPFTANKGRSASKLSVQTHDRSECTSSFRCSTKLEHRDGYLGQASS